MYMLRIFAFFFFLPFFCIAQIPKPQPDTYVNDYTNSLTQEQIQALNEQLLQLEKQSTVQVAILLINDLPTDMNIEDYAREAGNKWKVGINFNGAVYVAVLNQRRQRLEIAENLEGQIPDITAGQIIDNLKPYLQQRDYYTALSLLIVQIATAVGVTIESQVNPASDSLTSEQPLVDVPYVDAERKEYEREKAKYDKYGNYAIGGVIVGFIIFCIWAWRYKKKYREMYTVNGVYTGIGSPYYPIDSGNSGSSGGGSGVGGFGGGGGGGGFSGGGASGSW